MATCELCNEANPEDAVLCAGCSYPLPALGDTTVLPPGTVLHGGRYRVGKVLGRGGFGITYLGSDLTQRRPVAIKECFPDGARRRGLAVLSPSSLPQDDFDQLIVRYLAEGELIRRFSHPGIVVVHDVFAEHQTAYMAMEYHAVPDLADVLLDGPLSIARALEVVDAIGAALATLHEGGVLHRDVKPANILVYPDGRAVLIDFGTAREFVAGQTRRMTTLVTPGYAPLEQYTETARRGPYSDIYSLAGTLYHMLTGQRPVPATDRAVGIDLPRLTEVPGPLSDAVHRGLSMNVSHRPQTVADFLTSLHRDSGPAPPEPSMPDEAPTARVSPLLSVPGPEPTMRFKGHEALVSAVAVTATGRYAASGAWDGTVRLWDLEQGAEKWTHRLERSTVWVWDVAFDPAGQRLAVACEDRCVRLLDVETGDERSAFPLKTKPSALAFSPDGQRLSVATADRALRIFEIASGRETGVMQEHQGRITAVTWSPDGLLLASASEDGTVRLWESASGRQLYQISRGDRKARDVCFSPDGQVMAAAFDTMVLVLDASSVQERQHLNHAAVVASVAFSPDGAYVVTGTEDRQVHVWGTSSGRSATRLEPHGGKVMSVAWARGGSVLVTGGGDKLVRVWRLNNAPVSVAAPPPPRPATPYDRPTGLFRGHWAPVRCVAFTPDGANLVTGSEDRTVRIWDLSSGREAFQVGDSSAAVHTLAISDRTLVTGAEDGAIRQFDTAAWTEQRLLKGHKGPVQALAAGGGRVASGATDGVVLVWVDTADVPRHTFKGHANAVTSLAFYPDGRWLLSASEDRTVCVWDVSSGKLLRRLTGHSSVVCCVVVSKQEVYTASFDRSVRQWADTRETRRYMGHKAPVRSVAASPDGRWLVSGSDDRTLRFWDAAGGQEIHRIDLRGGISQVVCSPDGQHIAWTCFEPTVRLVKVEKFIAPLASADCGIRSGSAPGTEPSRS